MPETIDDVRQLIETRLAEIQAETRELEGALSGLREGTARRPGRRGPKRKRTTTETAISATRAPTRRPAPRRKNAKRAPRGRRREQLLAAIEASPGARPSELAKTIGIRPTQVSVLIARARADKLIVKSGKGYSLKS